jgi:hypothetical protein
MIETTRYRVLPDGNVLAHIPFRIVRKTDGLRLLTDAPGANKDRNMELANIQMVATGLKYRRMVLTDEFKTRSKMARHLGFDSSYLTRVIRLGYLSPIIVEKVTTGELAHISVERLQKIQTAIWAEQHKELGLE